MVRVGEMFVLRKWFLAKKKSCKCLKPCQRRKGSAGRRCGCSRCGLAGSPSVPLRFQPALRAPERAGVRTRPGRSSQTHTGRPNRTFFAATSPNARYELSTGGFRPSHRTTLCSLSVKFRRAPHGPETQRHSWHRTVLQQPGPGPVITSYLQVVTSNLQTRSCRHQSTIYRTVTSGFPLPCHSGSLSSSTSDRANRMGIPPIWID